MINQETTLTEWLRRQADEPIYGAASTLSSLITAEMGPEATPASVEAITEMVHGVIRVYKKHTDLGEQWRDEDYDAHWEHTLHHLDFAWRGNEDTDGESHIHHAALRLAFAGAVK